tara:strand:- start:5677 stop:7275 length:1599 start_codon:yes stop_codon:yes gene_type:complete
MIRKFIAFLAATVISCSAVAQQANVIDLSVFQSDEQKHLTFQEAFRFTPVVEDNQVRLVIETEPGHYLYRESFEFTVTDGLVGSNIGWSDVKMKEDEYRGLTSVIEDEGYAVIPIYNTTKTTLTVRAQGCSAKGVCYIPQTFNYTLYDITETPQEVIISIGSKKSDNTDTSVHEDKTPWSYILIGLLIALTPCTFPLIPIVLGALGKNKLITSIAYLNGLALTFVTIGTITTLSGSMILPYINSLPFYLVLACVFAWLGYAMYSDKAIYLGQGANEKIEKLSQKAKFDTAKAFIIGAASGVLATPCTAAPLLAVFTHLSLQDDLSYTVTSLYAVAIGISLPLVIIALVGQKSFMRPGTWMVMIKNGIAGGIAAYPALMLLPFSYEVAIGYAILIIVCSLIIIKDKSLLVAIPTQAIILALTFIQQPQPPTQIVTAETPLTGTFALKIQADWCTSCMHNSSVIEESGMEQKIPFKTLDLTTMEDFEEQYLKKHKVLGVPIIHAYVDGKIVASLTGEFDEVKFINWVNNSFQIK